MQTKIIKGIIVSKTPYAEHDEMLNVLTEEGFLNIYAKGVKKTESKNRINIFRGSLVSFEIFNSYATEHSVLLKKAVMIQALPDVTKTNSMKIESLLKAIKNIREGDIELYKTYIELLNDFDGPNFWKNQSFLISQILNHMGVGLSFSSCVYCGSNQELLDFDASQGGIICKNHTKNNVALKLLKSLFLLGYSREKYVLETSPETNQEVLKMIGDLLI